jgi:hypothetical protein
MGVKFDRIVDGFDGPFEAVPDVMKPPAGHVEGFGQGAAGWSATRPTTASSCPTAC